MKTTALLPFDVIGEKCVRVLTLKTFSWQLCNLSPMSRRRLFQNIALKFKFLRQLFDDLNTFPI